MYETEKFNSQINKKTISINVNNIPVIKIIIEHVTTHTIATFTNSIYGIVRKQIGTLSKLKIMNSLVHVQSNGWIKYN